MIQTQMSALDATRLAKINDDELVLWINSKFLGLIVKKNIISFY